MWGQNIEHMRQCVTDNQWQYTHIDVISLFSIPRDNLKELAPLCSKLVEQ